MATLPTQSFSQIVTNTITGIQGRASKLVNFSIGSTLRAIVEGFAGLFLWFQTMVILVLQATRLSTSKGVDVDTFTADFMPTVGTSNGVPSPRLGAEPSSGQVTYSRLTPAPSSCFIPAAASVSVTGVITNAGPNNAATMQTSDGSQNFVVIANPTYGTYSASLGGYTLASEVSSINVPVQALTPGSGGNVLAGNISVMTTGIVGIDSVTNAANFTNGFDQESDVALKDRFALYILGLSRGDLYGTSAAVEGVQAEVQYTITEGFNYDGSYRPGYYLIVADDGSGNPSAAFLTLVTNAAQSVRPLGVQVGVFAPVIITANVSMTLATAASYDHNTVVAEVAAAVATNINSLGLGVALPWSILASWAYAIPGVTAVSSVLLNGSGGDAASISVTRLCSDNSTTIAYATVKAGTLTIS